MDKINIIYISIEGNTRNFVKNLSSYAEAEHAKDDTNPVINAKEVSEQTDFSNEEENFFRICTNILRWWEWN